MHPRTLLPAGLAAGALLLAACGGDDPAGTGADRAFAGAMVPHHTSAIEMAELARERGESAFVRRLAEDVVRSQRAEIETLRREDAELAEAGVERGDLGVPAHAMGMDMDMQALETARPFDRAFMEEMTVHHQGAVAMARAELERGEDPELQALARSIIAEQEREIRAMRAQLARTAPA